MKTLANLVLGVALSLAVTSHAQVKHYKIFLLTGQSNALGTTAGDSFDPSTENVPADQQIPFFWSNVADIDTKIGDSGGEFKSLCAQQGGYYTNCDLHWGPEIGFGRALYAAGVRDFGIVKACRGGGGNSLWSKEQGGHMYNELVATARQAAESLQRSGHSIEIVGLLYLQGESDSPEEAQLAGERLRTLLTTLRKDLPHADNLQLVIGGIAAAGEKSDLVRKKQSGLGKSMNAVSYFDTTDLRASLYDDLHFDRPAKIVVGERFARAVLEKGVVKSDQFAWPIPP